MPSSTIRFTPDFIKCCENIWRDGFTKSTQGVQELPDFKSFFVNDKIKEEPTLSEMENLPFNPCKCEARLEKNGYAIQCTRSPFEGLSLCKTHQKMFDKLPQGKDIPYGRFNQPRPDITLDKGNPINWGPKKSRNKSSSDTPKQPKLKVGEMRDYLSSRIPNTAFKGLKKKELTDLYFKEKQKENYPGSSSDEEQVASTPENQEEELVASTPENQEEGQVASTPEKQEEELVASTPEKQEEELVSSTPENQEEEQVVSTPENQEDDAMGVGLNLEINIPKTVSEFKKLFKEIGIDASGLSGKREYKQAYDDYLKSKEEEEEEHTEPLSDDEDLQEDTNTYDETSFEGVDYLEDEDTGKIYNMKHQHVGKWNADIDNIIWVSDEFKTAHENSRP